MTATRATYRVQLSSEFTFDDAAALAPYLATLGVSHLYCSPILQAAAGSTHGYDVVDPTRINEELGGADGFARLVEALKQRSLGLIVDIVPNHMATAGKSNPWWWDVLEHGPSSRYADYFDIDWDPATSSMKDKILLGVLADRYGRELQAQELKLERHGLDVLLRYHDLVFPIPRGTFGDREDEGVQRSPGAMDALLQRQHYRLAYWRSAQEELNYRRFFTVDSLIGLRVEKLKVFDDSHRAILELVASGAVSGIRVDHVDGLRDPVAYLQRLREAAPTAYIAVEKILAWGEQLPSAFAVDGTTGYEFIAAVEGLFVDTEHEAAMTALYHAFTGETHPYPEVAHAAKLEVASTELAPDIERLTAVLVEICDADWRHRDRTRRELREALLEVAVDFGVYRTYVTGSDTRIEDRHAVATAIDEALRQRPEMDSELLALIKDILLLEPPEGPAEAFAARFQQLTPAVMAKGVEDTAFYRYNRLVSLNEVGGDPGTFGRAVEGFHDWCARVAANWPNGMVTLSTHDTKRSGDVRARIDVLSEIPGEWEPAVRRWAEHNDRYRTQGYPDRNLEYLVYQTLVGAWPLEAERLRGFLLKAAREASVHTSWVNPVAAYEDAVATFVDHVMADAEFTSDLESFLGRTQIVGHGRTNSLVQATLLLTAPGVPDLYQGSELWQLTLVDPDNRRPVDFATRQKLLAEVGGLRAAVALARSDEGATKLWLTARLLGERARRPALFASRDHVPLLATGARARHALSFTRGALLVVVPRLVAQLGGDWGDTRLVLPRGEWTDLLTGERRPGGASPVGEILSGFPVAVLAREMAGHID